MTLIGPVSGTIALVTSLVGLLPQSWKAFKTRSTRDLSLIMLVNYLCCSIAWILYGFSIGSAFVISSNIVGLASCLLLTGQKYYYDHLV